MEASFWTSPSLTPQIPQNKNPLNATNVVFKGLMPRAGIEPATQGFSVLCSTNWAIWALSCGNRIWTYDLRVMSPTSFQTAPSRDNMLSLLKRRMGRGGFEPPKQFAADLQSVPFGHSGIYPYKADDRTRTDNLLITNQLLYRLS